MKNRPDFIDSAEYRRNALLSSKEDRETIKDQIKIRFLEDHSLYPKSNSRYLMSKSKINTNFLWLVGPKLFTEQEMREITRKNYRKLPEVQQQTKYVRQQILRNADRYMANTLTKVKMFFKTSLF